MACDPQRANSGPFFRGRRWLALHRLVYLIAPLGVLHFWWMVKRDLTQPAIFAAILALLLGYRIVVKARADHPLVLRAAGRRPS
jgi:sulfoxide reductase heme-binding subunit YedZ